MPNKSAWEEMILLFFTGAISAIVLDSLGVGIVEIAIITFGMGLLWSFVKRRFRL
jgi:hypothetical protein